tara:strand:+ start:2539 stop:2967 length:429 start_codon:yes stop_codon:yes gene_type:complete
MANTVFRGSDITTTQVFATAAFPTTATPTNWIDCRGFTHVEFHIVLTNGATITALTLGVDYSISSTGQPHFPLTVEELDTTATPVAANQHKYTVQVAGAFSGTGGAYALPVPVHGRYMRLQLAGGPAAGTDQATVVAYRRTT